MDVEPKIRGFYPPKWMVYFMENPIKMDDLGGFPHIFGNTHVYVCIKCISLRILAHLVSG